VGARRGAHGHALAPRRRGCYNSDLAMIDRPAHHAVHTAPRGAGYPYVSYRTWRFS
jgi:hypothetical protein